ncbi:hypothetical protein ACFPM0_36805 [Pseudonocardia sulfidoxydans]
MALVRRGSLVSAAGRSVRVSWTSGGRRFSPAPPLYRLQAKAALEC